MLGVLRREYVIERCQLIVVGIAGLRIAAVQVLGQFQHIVRVTGLRTVDVVDEVDAGLLAGEVLATTVSAKCQRTFAGDNIPEVVCCLMVRLVASKFADALKSHHLRHLCIGMHIIEIVLTLRHGCQQSPMRETLGCHQILPVLRNGIGIGQHFIHTSVLVV